MSYVQNKSRTFHPEENPCLPLLSFKIFALKFFIQCHIYKFSPCLCKFLLKHYSFFFCLLPSKWTPKNFIHNAIRLSYANFQLNIPHQIGNMKMQSYKPMLLKWEFLCVYIGSGREAQLCSSSPSPKENFGFLLCHSVPYFYKHSILQVLVCYSCPGVMLITLVSFILQYLCF